MDLIYASPFLELLDSGRALAAAATVGRITINVLLYGTL